MKAVVQRVLQAAVTVDSRTVGAIGPGLLVYLGLEKDDGAGELEWMVAKVAGMRVFEDAAGKMNLPLGDREVLLISQFTLAGDLTRGRRPGFEGALAVEAARAWWPKVVSAFQKACPRLATGEFQAAMRVSSVNDGPATFWLETPNTKRPVTTTS